jgi:hypothetical protein
MNLNNLIKQFLFKLDIRGIDTETLPNAPTGWREMIVEYSRSKTYSGILRNITGQLDFIGKAAYILRREYAKYRLMARVNFLIDRDTRQPYNTYSNLYTGQIDFSKKVDKQGTFTVGAKSLDFSQNIDAYDSQQYTIPLTGGINLELPGIQLTENPQLIFSTSPDFRSNAFFEMEIASYNQMSIAPSVSGQGFLASDAPVFEVGTSPHFFTAQVDGKLQLQGDIASSVNSGQFQFNIYSTGGTLVKTLFQTPVYSTTTQTNFNWNFTINVTKGESLFFYIKRTAGGGGTFQGVNMQNGSLLLFYNTITPPTMCQALSGHQLFAALLQAMNVNQDSGPNLPVAYQSFLLNGALRPLYFTSSDSIRAAQGSIFKAGDTIGPGVYKVITAESITYSGTTYTTGQQFPFIVTAVTFTGDGAVQKIQSILVGALYNIGDSLQSGGTYLVEGLNNGHVTYNATTYNIGDFFKYVLGQETFTGSDDSMFVKQIAIDPQIIISFADFFQCIKSVQGGDCAFGVNPKPFIETLANVFMSGGTTNLGNVPKDWQSECATDMLYNTIKVGQNDQQYDAVNGVQEVSSEQYYSSAQLMPATELNLISSVRFDPYGIETVRITQNDTAASRSDNNTFGVWINTTPVSTTPFEYYRPLSSSDGTLQISGVSPSYYNFKLSPKTNLLRGSRYLASIFYNMPGYQLRLTGYEKNVGMSYIGLDGIKISESAPIDMLGLGSPYFIPEYYTMTIPGGLIDTNSYADMAFTVNGNIMRGFVMSYKCNFANNVPQPVKLLLGPGNDLGKSVR